MTVLTRRVESHFITIDPYGCEHVTGYTVYTNGDALCVYVDEKEYTDFDGSRQTVTLYRATGLDNRQAKGLFRACQKVEDRAHAAADERHAAELTEFEPLPDDYLAEFSPAERRSLRAALA